MSKCGDFLFFYFVTWLITENIPVPLIATLAFILYAPKENCHKDMLKEWPQIWCDFIFI